MELSEKAVAFSIDSLILASVADEEHDRSRSAEIFSRAIGGEANTAERGGDKSAICSAGSLVSLNDALVYRATNLFKNISVQDRIETAARAPSTFAPREILPLAAYECVRPKIQNPTPLQPKQLVRKRKTTGRGHLGGPCEGNGERLGRGTAIQDTSFNLREPPDFEGRDKPSGGTCPGTGDAGERAGDGTALPEEPFSITAYGIQVTLENSNLWKQFSKCGTEMIVNRIGRRMFPCIVTTIRGMETTALYRVQMELDSSNRRRYKFINGQWLAVGKADPEHPNSPFDHPSSPSPGAFWMQDKVSFAKLKITNNKETGKTNTVLHSMHKYTPRIIITKIKQPADRREIACVGTSLPTEGGLVHHHQQTLLVRDSPVYFEFKETAFIAVTAYHSELITQLKIQNNPFAKAFRDADVTAILQGAHMLSQECAQSVLPGYSSGLTPLMHPDFSSMEWQAPSTVRHDCIADPDHSTESSHDANYGRHGGPIVLPEFPDPPWSFDNIAPMRPPRSHPWGVEDGAEGATLLGGNAQCRSQAAMVAFDGGARNALSAPHFRLDSVDVPSVHALHDVLQEAEVDRSSSQPELSSERPGPGQPTSNKPLQHSEFRLPVDNQSDAVYFPLRRVSSAAVNRSVKRNTLPYFSSKKSASIYRHRSADSYIFQKTGDPQAGLLRRHSYAQETPLLTRASTGNIRGKMESESDLFRPQFDLLSAVSKSALPAPRGGVPGEASTSHRARPKKKAKEILTHRAHEPDPADLKLNNP